ncbi:hypothetical protein [Photobacterium sp. TY1-4]|uniref:hypothetical protein n=1 Tax=Photobacterium sp. TY1-4 TaxID=2899122 RepID=UPI0021C16EDF|nr:hypothetical protein [Photobacterium sp. TY1-4]UXI03496.1 hypothetical protein NH461_24050 [Photobacterium sp. TY1-4]
MKEGLNVIRFIQLIVALSLLAGVGYFILQGAPHPDEHEPKYKFLVSKYRSETEEHRNLYLHHASLQDIPMPVGSWEAFAGPGRHFLLKVNEKGGFVLSINPNANDDSEGAITGILKITGQAFKAHHVVGSAKQVIPKSGHIIVKSYADSAFQLIHPQTMEVIRFERIAG